MGVGTTLPTQTTRVHATIIGVAAIIVEPAKFEHR